MEKINPLIENGWKIALDKEFRSEYFFNLKKFLVEEKKKYVVYPLGQQLFSAFNFTPFELVRVVILGQDPYHGKGQANGLCFSVSEGVAKPPSLNNIFKELYDDLGIPVSQKGNLEKWARQGVLLLNATLTVKANIAGSHQNKGWEQFTDAVIKKLSDEKTGLVFILWGNFAQAKQSLIDTSKHHILKSAHPSPFSAYNGFFGNKHFSKTNNILSNQGLPEIDWSVE